MSNRTLPMMPWYPDQFAASTRHWTWAERALYRDLLDLQWQVGTIPANERRLSGAVKLPLKRFKRLWSTVQTKFDAVEGGLQNYRLEQHRLAGINSKESRRLGAKLTNEKRWGKPYIKESLSDRSADRSADRSSVAERVAHESPPSPSPEIREDPSDFPPSGKDDSPNGVSTPREHGTNPRALGTNPRADGTNPRALRNRSLEAWRETIAGIDQVAATGSLPAAQRLTWADLETRVHDPVALRAAESVGFRLIADRDKFTTTDLQARFRETYEQQIRSVPSQPPPERYTPETRDIPF